MVVWPHPPHPAAPSLYFATDRCIICMQPTPTVSAARAIHVRALLLCSYIRMASTGRRNPVPDLRRAKSCRACRYWLEIGLKKFEDLIQESEIDLQELLDALERYWRSSVPTAADFGPILGIYSPGDLRPRTLRKHLIHFVKKTVTPDMILRFRFELVRLSHNRPPQLLNN